MDMPEFDKTVVDVVDLGDDSGDKEYWWSLTPDERWAIVEHLRRLNYGYDPDTTRMERVLEIVDSE
jgi:hypothetical protein